MRLGCRWFWETQPRLVLQLLDRFKMIRYEFETDLWVFFDNFITKNSTSPVFMFQYEFVPSTFHAFITVYPAVDCRHNSENWEKTFNYSKIATLYGSFHLIEPIMHSHKLTTLKIQFSRVIWTKTAKVCYYLVSSIVSDFTCILLKCNLNHFKDFGPQ